MMIVLSLRVCRGPQCFRIYRNPGPWKIQFRVFRGLGFRGLRLRVEGIKVFQRHSCHFFAVSLCTETTKNIEEHVENGFAVASG